MGKAMWQTFEVTATWKDTLVFKGMGKSMHGMSDVATLLLQRDCKAVPNYSVYRVE